jgi:hypothetical protein
MSSSRSTGRQFCRIDTGSSIRDELPPNTLRFSRAPARKTLYGGTGVLQKTDDLDRTIDERRRVMQVEDTNRGPVCPTLSDR